MKNKRRKSKTPVTQRDYTAQWPTYTLLDSGKGRKLEQFGEYRLVRPEPRAVWRPVWSEEEWAGADAEYVLAEKRSGGDWAFRNEIPTKWKMSYKDLRFWVELEISKQVGVFPENAVQWDWIEGVIKKANRPLKVLNLFGYTGLASLAAARAGAEVTHIDSSKRAIRLGRENQTLNDLEDLPIRWIVEDALKFAQREVKRGVKYDAIIMDPPKYGLGPKRERWEFFKNFETLCDVLRNVLSDSPLFVVVTAYALDSPAEILTPYLQSMMRMRKGKFEVGELVLKEKSAGRMISPSITARWEAESSR